MQRGRRPRDDGKLKASPAGGDRGIGLGQQPDRTGQAPLLRTTGESPWQLLGIEMEAQPVQRCIFGDAVPHDSLPLAPPFQCLAPWAGSSAWTENR